MTTRRHTSTLVRIVLDHRHDSPWTGLADAPPEVVYALNDLEDRIGWKPRPTPRRKAAPVQKRKTPKSRPVPEWASDLIRQVCEAEGRRPPKITWYQRNESSSSGCTYKSEGRIHVTAGTDDVDARLVLLHELAHWFAPPKWNHTRQFWGLAWRLYDVYMPEHLPYILIREASNFGKARTYCPFATLRENQ